MINEYARSARGFRKGGMLFDRLAVEIEKNKTRKNDVIHSITPPILYFMPEQENLGDARKAGHFPEQQGENTPNQAIEHVTESKERLRKKLVLKITGLAAMLGSFAGGGYYAGRSLAEEVALQKQQTLEDQQRALEVGLQESFQREVELSDKYNIKEEQLEKVESKAQRLIKQTKQLSRSLKEEQRERFISVAGGPIVLEKNVVAEGDVTHIGMTIVVPWGIEQDRYSGSFDIPLNTEGWTIINHTFVSTKDKRGKVLILEGFDQRAGAKPNSFIVDIRQAPLENKNGVLYDTHELWARTTVFKDGVATIYPTQGLTPENSRAPTETIIVRP